VSSATNEPLNSPLPLLGLLGLPPVLTQTQALTAQAGQHALGAAAFAAATLPVYDATADDPNLPAELLPAELLPTDWPGDQLASTLGQGLRTFYPLINDYLAAVTGA
jgi:DNA-binding transcriptional regulator PaaX